MILSTISMSYLTKPLSSLLSILSLCSERKRKRSMWQGIVSQVAMSLHINAVCPRRKDEA